MWWYSGVTTLFCLLLKDACFAINSRLLNNELTLSPVESSRLFATIRGLLNSIHVLKAYVQNPFLCLCGAYGSGAPILLDLFLVIAAVMMGSSWPVQAYGKSFSLNILKILSQYVFWLHIKPQFNFYLLLLYCFITVHLKCNPKE